MHKGAAAPLVGGAGAWRVPALFAGLATCSGVGGTRPPRLSPGGGNGKGGVQNSPLPQAASSRFNPSFYLFPIQREALCVLPEISPRRLALLPFALCSGAMLRCQLVSSILKRVLPSQYRTEPPPSPETLVPPRPRSHPNSAMGLQTTLRCPLLGPCRRAVPQRLVYFACPPQPV